MISRQRTRFSIIVLPMIQPYNLKSSSSDSSLDILLFYLAIIRHFSSCSIRSVSEFLLMADRCFFYSLIKYFGLMTISQIVSSRPNRSLFFFFVCGGWYGRSYRSSDLDLVFRRSISTSHGNVFKMLSPLLCSDKRILYLFIKVAHSWIFLLMRFRWLNLKSCLTCAKYDC